jgi:aminoglycoside phosphotransferase family enzyme/predicted kinase
MLAKIRRQPRQKRDSKGPGKAAGGAGANPHVVGDQGDVLAFLSRADTYGISSEPIRIDTHAAVVFLAGTYAYKMKRAVRFPFLDFSTLERRRRVCEAELELNRPNAPELYVDTIPVVRRDGALKLGGDGEVVEWLLRMRRFDPADTLDHVADRGGLTGEMIAKIVDAIVTAHRRAPVADGDAATRRLQSWMRGNFDEILETPDAFPPADVEELRRASEAEFNRVAGLLFARGRQGCVRRCHGDLHLRNIVLIEGRPVLFDALEFDDAFATHDLFYDLAFLLMDIWQRGLKAESNQVLNRYLWQRDEVGDIDACALLPLLMSIRAAIRAKVAIMTAPFEDPESAKACIAEGRRYLAFAEAFLVPVAPRLIAVGGLSGTGKTSISAAIAAELGRPPGALHLRSDIERKRLFGVGDTARLPPAGYTQEASDAIYARLRDKAGRAIKAGQSVVVDAVHSRPDEREAIEAVARENGAAFTGIWLDAPEKTLIERVAARTGDASDADAEVVRRQLSYDIGPIKWTKLDASQGIEQLRRQILERIRADT